MMQFSVWLMLKAVGATWGSWGRLSDAVQCRIAYVCNIFAIAQFRCKANGGKGCREVEKVADCLPNPCNPHDFVA
jgi:hypothetical protein